MRAALALLLCLVATLPAAAEEAPGGTALVTTAIPRHGSLPDIVTTYGSAAPALDGGMAISLQTQGRVATILVTPGERVSAGTNLLAFDVAASATSTYSQAQTALALAQTERAHAKALFAQRLVTRDQLAQAGKAVSDAQATFAALEQQGVGRSQIVVKAPFDGIVQAIPVAQGDRVAAGGALLTLTRLDGLVVTVGVEPALHDRIKPGQPARLVGMAGGATFQGTVRRIDDVINPRTRLIDVDIAVPAGAVISGAFYRVGITLGAFDGWLVPHDSVLQDADGFFLFQLAPGKHGPEAKRVAVRVLATRDAQDIVDATLDAKRPVVVEGATQVANGDPVRTAP